MFMRLVLRLGGSVIGSPINSTLIGKYSDILKELKERKHDLAVVVGGGFIAREFIEAAKDLSLSEKVQDEVAIHVSRIFARLLLEKLGDQACSDVSPTVEDASTCMASGKIAVMGGLRPGMTTDTVAALVAKKVGADLYVKATNQEGVYNKDPKKYSDAVKLEHLSFEDLFKLLEEDTHKAGIHQVLDPNAASILGKGRVKVIVVSGFKPENVLLAVEGENVGTSIR